MLTTQFKCETDQLYESIISASRNACCNACCRALLCLAVLSWSIHDALSQTDKPRHSDRSAVTTCLQLVEQSLKSQSEVADADEATGEKIEPAKWLAGAGKRAAVDQVSCIGVVASPCQQTSEGRSNTGSADCMRRELAVWDERLNEAYKRWIAQCDDKKICESRRKLERAWVAVRDARCALPWIEMEGSIAIPLTSSCLLELTARQAIWLQRGGQ